jgi:hypothetical protein
MTRVFILFICLFSSIAIRSQIHEVGVFLGGSNYIGDVGPTTYVTPKAPAFGILYKYNKSPRHAYRLSYTQSKITASDLDSKEPSRNRRGYDFENNIKELSLGLEFNFFDYNLHELGKKITPFVYSGISYFRYDELYIRSGETRKNYNENSFAIPIVLGVKATVSRSLILALEIGARYTMTDNIDASNPKNEGLKNLRFGNINNNDWYVFSGVTLTYTFGETPCYCAD